MTVNRGLFVRNNGTVGTTPIQGRLVLASLVAENAPGTPRNGLLDQKATTVVAGTANMSYDVSAITAVVNRAAGEGVYLFTATGTTNVTTTAAPGTGSRYDLIYLLQRDLDKGDADNTAVLAVYQGTAATSPTKPYASLPAGAYVLAEALVATGATATNGAGVTITQVWRYTSLRGAAIPVRNSSERDEITTPTVGLQVKRLDWNPSGASTQTWNGTGWIMGVQHVEFTRVGQNDEPANTMWGPGMFDAMIDTNNSVGNYSDWLAYPSNDNLTITKEGLYTVQWKVVAPSGATIWFGIGDSPSTVNAGPFGRVPVYAIPAGDSYWTPAVTFYVPPAGQNLTFQFSSGNAYATLNHRMKLTKHI